MTHQQYEEWLFSDEPLAPEDQAALQVHLQTCESCRALTIAWQDLEAYLHAAPPAEPLPGFGLRFEKRLEGERQRLHRRQSLAILGFSLAGAVLLFASLLLLVWPVLQSPKVVLWTLAYQLLSLVKFADLIGFAAAELFQVTTSSVPWVWWVLAAGMICELGVLWVVSFRLLTNPRRVTK